MTVIAVIAVGSFEILLGLVLVSTALGRIARALEDLSKVS